MSDKVLKAMDFELSEFPARAIVQTFNGQMNTRLCWMYYDKQNNLCYGKGMTISLYDGIDDALEAIYYWMKALEVTGVTFEEQLGALMTKEELCTSTS